MSEKFCDTGSMMSFSCVAEKGDPSTCNWMKQALTERPENLALIVSTVTRDNCPFAQQVIAYINEHARSANS